MRRGRTSSSRQVVGPTTITIPVQSLSAGTQSANAFTGWTSPATNVFTDTAYGLTGGKFLSVNPSTNFIAKSTGVSRDQEITFFASIGTVYLRLTDDGTAWVFNVNDYGNGYGIYLVTGLADGNANPGGVGPGYTTYIDNLFIVDLPPIASVPGRTYPVTSQKLWTFGVEGFEVYLKYDGVEFWRSKTFHHLAPGRIALGGHPVYGSYGFSSISATHKVNVSLISDTTTKVFDLRDFGMKSLKATGSISAASTSFVLDGANPGFAVGDKVCIAVGGEAGGGVPGEQGVGGSWPTLKYLTVAAMNSDTTQANAKVCGVMENGNSYQWNGSAWVAYTGNLARYLEKILPQAHSATITAVSGSTLTLDIPSVAAATGAKVYFDSAPLIDATICHPRSGIRRQTGCTISIPAGDDWVFAGYHISLGSIPGLKVLGAGRELTTIVSPPGAKETGFSIATCNDGRAADIGFHQNTRADKGFMFGFHPTLDYWIAASECIRLSTSDDFIVEDIKGVNHSVSVVSQNFCNNPIIRRIKCVHETGHINYFQWAVNIADSWNGLIEDIEFDFAKLTCGCETFRSTGTIIRRLTGRNAKLSSNSAGSFRWETCSLTWEANCGDVTPAMAALPMGQRFPSPYEPMLNLNSNIDNQSGTETPTGGVVENFDMDVQGRIFTGDIGAQMISVSGTVNNVTIKGKYQAKPVTAPSGRITLPNVGSDYCMYVRVDDPAKTVVVDGVRVETGSPMVTIGSNGGYTLPAGMTVQNSVIDALPAIINGTVSSNITNAAYNAL